MNSIKQPGDVKVQVDGTLTAHLQWSKTFAGKWNGRYTQAQKFVDSQVLRLDDKYVPVRQSYLRKSGFLGTVIGSGLVRYIAPYARYQYYGKVMVGPAPKTLTSIPLKYHSGDPNRGAKWFEVMKARHGRQIISGAKKLMGGRS